MFMEKWPFRWTSPTPRRYTLQGPGAARLTPVKPGDAGSLICGRLGPTRGAVPLGVPCRLRRTGSPGGARALASGEAVVSLLNGRIRRRAGAVTRLEPRFRLCAGTLPALAPTSRGASGAVPAPPSRPAGPPPRPEMWTLTPIFGTILSSSDAGARADCWRGGRVDGTWRCRLRRALGWFPAGPAGRRCWGRHGCGAWRCRGRHDRLEGRGTGSVRPPECELGSEQ
jgi:hypothetical protein